MPPLPIISGRACIKALRRAGFAVVRQRGTLRGIISDAGLTVAEFLTLLR